MPQTLTIYRTGTEHCTITEVHPYHVPVGRIDHTGAGTYTTGVDPQCPLCRQEEDSWRVARCSLTAAA